MSSITISDVPEATLTELAARATRSGRSLQDYLRAELIALGDRPDLDQLVAWVRHRERATGSTLAADEILEHLRADRR